MIRIIAVGKKHEEWIRDGLERYEKRLRRPFDVEWVLLPHSTADGPRARQDESERIGARLEGGFVILLDERGKLLDSPSLAKLLMTSLESSAKVTIIIGGAYGVTEALQQRADIVWSLSPLVFPHQLVRLLLIEQVYRSQQIVLQGPYHHE